MNTKDYLKEYYLNDLDLFLQSHSRDCLSFCPLIKTFDLKDSQSKLIDIKSFFAVQYALNLLSQGIYCHFRNHHESWLKEQLDFLKITGCHAHYMNGTNMSRPLDMIQILQHNKLQIPKKNLHKFVNFFIWNNLSSIRQEEFCKKLEGDSDCIEIHHLLGGQLGQESLENLK